jgi:hypothetical protein
MAKTGRAFKTRTGLKKLEARFREEVGSSAGCEGARGGVGVRNRPTITVLLAQSFYR